MKYVSVVFGDGKKTYAYLTNLELIKGAVYDIIVDGSYCYSTPVKVVSISDEIKESYFKLRTITKAICLKAPAAPDSKIKNVYFNKEKGTTVVVWSDDTKTKVKCQNGDTFDKEKGLAMCYVKKMMGNRGCFNEIFKKWCQEE